MGNSKDKPTVDIELANGERVTVVPIISDGFQSL